MTIVGFHARNHAQQVRVRGPLDSVDDRRTPADLYAALDAELGPFTLDAAASADNAKCARYFTLADDALEQRWRAGRVWVNPPYSQCRSWVTKAWHEWGEQDGPTLIAMLLPANRTEQSWWQEMIEPYRDRAASPLAVRFLAGRLRFDVPDGTYSDPRGNRPPFGCVLLVWEREHEDGHRA